jgi:hypothetical protein
MPESMGPKNNVRLCCRAEKGMALRRKGDLEGALNEFSTVAKSGVILLHQDLLYRELRLTQSELGRNEQVMESIDRELDFLRNRFPVDSFHRAKRLQQLGLDLIDFGLAIKAREVLRESTISLAAQQHGQWKLEMAGFDIAKLSLEIEPADSEAGQIASLDLEESWLKLKVLSETAFPKQRQTLAESIEKVVQIYESEMDDRTANLWQSRLETLNAAITNGFSETND